MVQHDRHAPDERRIRSSSTQSTTCAYVSFMSPRRVIHTNVPWRMYLVHLPLMHDANVSVLRTETLMNCRTCVT